MWLFNWWVQRFTGPGKTLLVVWTSLLAVAAIPGWSGALLPLGLGFCALSMAWLTTIVAPKLEAQWNFPSGITEGQSFSLIIHIHNSGLRELRDAGAWFFWADQWLQAQGEPRTVAKLAPGESARIVVPMRALRRGPFTLQGPLAFVLDPMGLMRRRCQVLQKTTVLVRPRMVAYEIENFLVRGTSGQEFSRVLLPQHHRSTELLGVREYRAGDEVRDIHHRTWARLGKPFTKEFGKERGAGIVLVVETGCMRYLERRNVDAMLRIAAGVAQWLVERGVLGRFLLDGQEVPIPQGFGALETILDTLAEIPVPLWWAWPSPSVFSPSARSLGPVLAISCSPQWVSQDRAYQGGICKRVLVSHTRISSQDERLLWIDAQGGAWA